MSVKYHLLSLGLIFLLIIESNGSDPLSIKNNSTPSPYDNDSREFNIVSYNIWALPIWLPNGAQTKRYNELPERLLKLDADILCIQEGFARKLRKKLLPELELKYHTGTDYSCNKPMAGILSSDCHGGLMTFSKFPIVEEVFYAYPISEGMRIEEKLGAKGFLWTLIETPSGKINVINTHLYAGPHSSDENQRILQVSYMNHILESRIETKIHPTFLVGDLNIAHPDIAKHTNHSESFVYSYILNDMGFTDPMAKISINECTINPSQNPYCNSKDGLQKLDYCLFRLPEFYRVDVGDQKVLFNGRHALSDHLAWSAEFDLIQLNVQNETPMLTSNFPNKVEQLSGASSQK